MTSDDQARTAPRSRDDFDRWGASLLRRWGYAHEIEFHLVNWQHDDHCGLHPSARPTLSSECQCEPDAVLILNIGTPRQRQIVLVLDGVELEPGSSPPTGASTAQTTH